MSTYAKNPKWILTYERGERQPEKPNTVRACWNVDNLREADVPIRREEHAKMAYMYFAFIKDAIQVLAERDTCHGAFSREICKENAQTNIWSIFLRGIFITLFYIKRKLKPSSSRLSNRTSGLFYDCGTIDCVCGDDIELCVLVASMKCWWIFLLWRIVVLLGQFDDLIWLQFLSAPQQEPQLVFRKPYLMHCIP